MPTKLNGNSTTGVENELRIMLNADIVLENLLMPATNRLQGPNPLREMAAVLRLTSTEVAWPPYDERSALALHNEQRFAR